MSVGRHYRAFISYSHADARIAAWLHRSLEGYRVPKRLRGAQGEFGAIPENLAPIFRDREDLASSGNLNASVQEALKQSDALVVVCSPDAARSPWVDQEVLTFKRLGRGARIYCLIVAGEPHAGDARECFPRSLRFELEADGSLGDRPAEPIAADLRSGKDGRGLALLKLTAGLLGTGLDDLRRREAQRKQRRLLAIAVASLAGMMLASGLAITAWIARNEARIAEKDAERRQAQTEDLLGFMLGDLRDRLDKVGRLDLLDSVYDKATGYFTSLDPRDLTDTTLSHQAELLTKIGQVRLQQARYPEALTSFRSAYARSSALAQRHPHDGDRLFDRGQAEYWVGFVYLQSRDLERARDWLTRYRDTCRAVYAIVPKHDVWVHELDPKHDSWVHELAYGDHNLAVLELIRGELDTALQGFERARGTLKLLLAKNPDDANLAFEIADNLSWQGSVEEQAGHLDNAEKLLAGKVDVLRRISARQPMDPNWKEQLSTTELLESELLRIRGQYAQAESLADGAVERMKALVAHDPTNKDWSRDYARTLVQRAAARIGGGKADAAMTDFALAQPLLETEGKVADADWLARRDLLDALALRIQWRIRTRDAGARADMEQSLKLQANDPHRDTADTISRYALAEWLAAVTDAGGVSPPVNDAHLLAARRALAPLAANSHYWRVLDPWLRVAIARDDATEAARVRKLLDTAGYVPLFPWPVASSAKP